MEYRCFDTSKCENKATKWYRNSVSDAFCRIKTCRALAKASETDMLVYSDAESLEMNKMKTKMDIEFSKKTENRCPFIRFANENAESNAKSDAG